MGTFKWPLRISSMDGQQGQDIEATVDTGASFTTLPSRFLRELGIEATGKRGFLLADGAAHRNGVRGSTSNHRRGYRDDHRGLRRGRGPSPAGGVHFGRSGPGCGPGGTTAGPHFHDPVLGRRTLTGNSLAVSGCHFSFLRGRRPGCLTPHSVPRTRSQTRPPVPQLLAPPRPL